MKNSQQKIRLTKQHWLNIIIISVSAMLLISVLVGRMLDSGEILQDDHSYDINLVQIDFSKIQFSLVDGIWISSKQDFQPEKIVKIVKHWKSLLLQQGQPISNKLILGKTVLIYLENVSQPIIAKMNLNKNSLQISFISAKQEFYLKPSEYSNYYPSITELN